MHSFGMSNEQQDLVWMEFKASKSFPVVGREVEVPAHPARQFVQQFGGIRPAARRRSPRQLSSQEREELSQGLALGESCCSIAQTIYLELFTPARKAVKADLVRRLRTGRMMRYPKRAKVPGEAADQGHGVDQGPTV